MKPGPSSLSSSASGRSSTSTGLISSEVARESKERLQVTSGDDTFTVFPDGSMENTVFSAFTGRPFRASSITWAMLSLSMTGRELVGWACGACCNFFCRKVRARSPSEGASPSASDWAHAATGSSTARSANQQSAARRSLGSRRCIEFGQLRAHVRRAAHKKSLGEMEGKRTYRRYTEVSALPRRPNRLGKSLDPLDPKCAQQGTSKLFHREFNAELMPSVTSTDVMNLQQARSTKTRDRIGYLHWLPLKYPACHRNPQCRVCQMPDFHKSLPTPDPLIGERLRRSRRALTLTLLYRQVQPTKVPSGRRK